MPLSIGLAGPRPGQPSELEPTVEFCDVDKYDDNTGGYYTFLHPFFSRLAEKTGNISIYMAMRSSAAMIFCCLDKYCLKHGN